MSGRRALVTGASRGIGQAVALALAESGYEVAAVARSADGLAETVAASSGTVVPLTCDMGDLDAVAGLGAAAAERLGGTVDALVHCAGISRTGSIPDLSLADWDESMRVNVTSALLLLQQCLPAMLQNGWGRVLTIGSIYSRLGAKRSGPYTASKHALLGLTRVTAMETASKGVTANCILPGYTDTEMVRTQVRTASELLGSTEDEAVKRILRVQPLGRMIHVEEVGALAAFLASDQAAAITGQAINIDGGWMQP